MSPLFGWTESCKHAHQREVRLPGIIQAIAGIENPATNNRRGPTSDGLPPSLPPFPGPGVGGEQ